MSTTIPSDEPKSWIRGRHACGHCFVVESSAKRLSRCRGCMLSYYCDVNCQSKDWIQHSQFCKNSTLKSHWEQSLKILTRPYEVGVPDSEKKINGLAKAITSLNLQQKWSKQVLVSCGALEYLLWCMESTSNGKLEGNEATKSKQYNYPLLAVVEAMQSDIPNRIDEVISSFLIYEINGVIPMIKALQKQYIPKTQIHSVIGLLFEFTISPSTSELMMDIIEEFISAISQLVSYIKTRTIMQTVCVTLMVLMRFNRNDFDRLSVIRSNIVQYFPLMDVLEFCGGRSKWEENHIERACVELVWYLIDSNKVLCPSLANCHSDMEKNPKFKSFLNDFLLDNMKTDMESAASRGMIELRLAMTSLFDIIGAPMDLSSASESHFLELEEQNPALLSCVATSISVVSMLFEEPLIPVCFYGQDWSQPKPGFPKSDPSLYISLGFSCDRELQMLVRWLTVKPDHQMMLNDTNNNHQNIIKIFQLMLNHDIFTIQWLEELAGMDFIECHFKHALKVYYYLLETQKQNSSQETQYQSMISDIEHVLSQFDVLQKKGSKLENSSS